MYTITNIYGMYPQSIGMDPICQACSSNDLQFWLPLAPLVVLSLASMSGERVLNCK